MNKYLKFLNNLNKTRRYSDGSIKVSAKSNPNSVAGALAEC